MHHHIRAVALPAEIGDFTDEVRRIFAELGGSIGGSVAGECVPALDVYEADAAVLITVDVPGVPASAVRVVARNGAVLIAGAKASGRRQGESSFHLVERGYGRFARVVRLSVPCDTLNAEARLADGELRIRVPRIADRRGRSIPIAVRDDRSH